MDFLKTLFSPVGLLLLVYLMIGIFYNTAAPHFPGTAGDAGQIAHSWIQYVISVLAWPLSLWHPEFTTGKWAP